MLEVRQLSKRYGDKLALDDVSVKVEPGKIVGLLGVNGAGKSTLMKIITGLEHQDSGFVYVDEQKQMGDKPPHLGYMIEDPSFYPHLSGYDNLRCLSYFYNDLPAGRIDEVLKTVGLWEAKKKEYHSYSLGMKKRLYFALAILSDPKILILDEPFNGIDPVSVAFFEKILKGYKEAGKMILISSHEIRELQSFIDEAVILDKGKIVYDETVKTGDDLFSIFLSHVSQGGEAQ